MRRQCDHLSDIELSHLQHDLREGKFSVRYLAKKYNLSERNVYIIKSEIFGINEKISEYVKAVLRDPLAGKKAKIRNRQRSEKQFTGKVEKKAFTQPNCLPSVAEKIKGGR